MWRKNDKYEVCIHMKKNFSHFAGILMLKNNWHCPVVRCDVVKIAIFFVCSGSGRSCSMITPFNTDFFYIILISDMYV